MSVTARIPVEYDHDPETGTWNFRVAEPRVVGGGCLTFEEAQQHAAEAIAYALDDDPVCAGHHITVTVG